jgi:hypothetical protein
LGILTSRGVEKKEMVTQTDEMEHLLQEIDEDFIDFAPLREFPALALSDDEPPATSHGYADAASQPTQQAKIQRPPPKKKPAPKNVIAHRRYAELDDIDDEDNSPDGNEDEPEIDHYKRPRQIKLKMRSTMKFKLSSKHTISSFFFRVLLAKYQVVLHVVPKVSQQIP